MKNKTKIQIASLVGAAIVTISSAFSMTRCYVEKQDIKEQKPYYQVLQDSENFNANMGVALNKNQRHNIDKYIRLKMDEDKPVVIECKGDMENREIELIEKAVNYYNQVFKTINKNYRFEFNGKKQINSTVIYVENGSIEEQDDSYTTYGRLDSKKGAIGENGEYYITEAKVTLDWEIIKNMDEDVIYYVILHELAHSFGFGDVYYDGHIKNTDIIDNTTIMKMGSWKKINHLFPNDYAILQVLYSDEYKKT